MEHHARNLWQSVDHTLDACIKCNICTTYCPVAAVTDLFPGPSMPPAGAALCENGQPISPDHAVDYCSGCRACNESLPHRRTHRRDERLRPPRSQRPRASLCATGCSPQRAIGHGRQLRTAPRQLRPAQPGELRSWRKSVMGIAREAPCPAGASTARLATGCTLRAVSDPSRTKKSSISTAAPPCTTSRSSDRRRRRPRT